MQATKAALQNAELNLAWTKVYSPIDGIAGVSNSQIGDLVGTSYEDDDGLPGQSHLGLLQRQREPLSQLCAPDRRDHYRQGQHSPTLKKTPVEFIQANDEPYPQKGNIIYVNRQVGTQTGTIQMAAEFPNPDAVLRPGGFGRVRIQTGDNKNALLVPQPAVIEVQSQYQVIVLTPDNKAMFRPVKMGERVGPNWIVTEGLKPGEKVVVEGILKVQQFAAAAPELAKEGIPVVAKPYVPPAAAAAGSN